MSTNILKIIAMKAQIQIGETIAVLFVFFILIAIGLIFYANVIKGNILSEKEESLQLKSIGIAQVVMFMPELQCSEDVVTEIQNCIDILKLESAVIKDSNNVLYYFDLLGFSNINVSEIYPNEAKWNIYSRKIGNFTNKFVTNVPISLYNPISRQYAFGVLNIETFT